MPYETDHLTAPRPHLARRARWEKGASPDDAGRARPPLNWLLIGVWATALVVSLAAWFGIAVTIVALT